MDKNKTIALLERLGLAPQKRFGQNFLISHTISEKITKIVLEDESEVIYEIGPGLGALSDYLVETAKQVKLVEIDHGLAFYLKKRYEEKANVEVIDQDILKVPFLQQRLSVISNLPYYITTSIIEKVILDNQNLVNFVFMVQQEVSERLFASPKSKEYGPLAVLLNLTGTIKHVLNADKTAFYPSPNVNSSVYAFRLKEHGLALRPLYKFIKALFLMRRKTLLNNLVTLVSDRNRATSIILQAGLDLKVRPEEVEAQKFVLLFKCFDEKGTEEGI